MKHLYLTLIASALTIAVSGQTLPKPSPYAEVEQRIGLTEVEIEYSRPGVKERVIWGELVPYDKLWRAGANKATQFSIDSDITIQGKELKAGDYSLFILPSKGDKWVFVFNTETELWGTGEYDEAKDALRVEATVESLNSSVERLEYRFLNVDMTTATLAMEWEKKRASLGIKVDPSNQVKESIAAALEEAEDGDKWKVYRNAAAYARDAGGMTEIGIEWITKSTDLKENWYAYWIYADLLAQKDDFKGAIEKAKRAMKIGMADAKAKGEEPFSYEARIQADIDAWSK